MPEVRHGRAILVTGGSGFIGCHVVAELVRARYSVSVLDIVEPTARVGPRVNWIPGDVTSRSVVRKALLGVDTVVNLAGASPIHVGDYASWATNAGGATTVAQEAASAGTHQFIHISSDAVYGPRVSSGHASEKQAANPQDSYGRSKHAGEAVVLSMLTAQQLRGIVFRPFAVIGPGQRIRKSCTPLLAAAIRSAHSGASITVPGDGEQVRDFVSVQDVAGIVRAAVDADLTTDVPVNVGRGKELSVTTILDLVEHVTGLPIERRIQRAPAASGWRADVTRADALFPGIRRQSVEETIRWTCDSWNGITSGG